MRRHCSSISVTNSRVLCVPPTPSLYPRAGPGEGGTAPGGKQERGLRIFKSCSLPTPPGPTPATPGFVPRAPPGLQEAALSTRAGLAPDEKPLLAAASSGHFVLIETAAPQVCGMSCQTHARPPRVAHVCLADEGGRRPSTLGPGTGQHLPQIYLLESSPRTWEAEPTTTTPRSLTPGLQSPGSSWVVQRVRNSVSSHPEPGLPDAPTPVPKCHPEKSGRNGQRSFQSSAVAPARPGRAHPGRNQHW